LAPVSARLARLLMVLVAVPLLAGSLDACSGRAGSASPGTSVPVATAAGPITAPPTTAPAPSPPSTAYAPSAPQTAPDAAAGALMDAWATGNRAEAVSVAAPAARRALFSAPYPPGGVQARGCTDPGTNPGTCTYADLSSGTLYEIGVVHLPGGWYVSTVRVEN
jgi:hypothetical protein